MLNGIYKRFFQLAGEAYSVRKYYINQLKMKNFRQNKAFPLYSRNMIMDGWVISYNLYQDANEL